VLWLGGTDNLGYGLDYRSNVCPCLLNALNTGEFAVSIRTYSDEAVAVISHRWENEFYLVKGYSRDTAKTGYDLKFSKKIPNCYQR